MNQDDSTKDNSLEDLKKAYAYYNQAVIFYVIGFVAKYVIAAFIPTVYNYHTTTSHFLATVMIYLSMIIYPLVLIYLLARVYKMATHLKNHNIEKIHPVLWVTVMIIPAINILFIIMMYVRAKKLIKQLDTTPVS